MKRILETEIRIGLAPLRAIHLFTPKGEEDWVPGWKPRYIEPSTHETVTGMVFETAAGGERTIWTCLDWSPREGRASYLRVVPYARVSRVDVHCRGDGGTGSLVGIRYEHVAISREGETWLAGVTQREFEAEIGGWQDDIEAAMAAGRIATAA